MVRHRFVLLFKYVSNRESSVIDRCVNTLRPSHNGRYFPDDILKCIFLNENIQISIKTWLKLVPSGPINNIPALVKIMTWRRPGDKPLSEPVMVRWPTHICVTRPQWVQQPLCPRGYCTQCAMTRSHRGLNEPYQADRWPMNSIELDLWSSNIKRT